MLDLVYPPLCTGCGQPLSSRLDILCVPCLAHLTPLDIGQYIDNPMVRHFWGRCPVEHSAALFGYYAGGRVQRIVRQIKYNNKKHVGRLLGQWLGRVMAAAPFFQDVDAVIPVPLHPKKQKSRGYNQSEWIGRGICDVLGCQLLTGQLIRRKRSLSQTTLSRVERHRNMADAFQFKTPENLFEHLLLVDDVVTTGATLEACINAMASKTNAKVSVAALGLGGA